MALSINLGISLSTLDVLTSAERQRFPIWYIRVWFKGGQDTGTCDKEVEGITELEGTEKGWVIPNGSIEGVGRTTSASRSVRSTTYAVSVVVSFSDPHHLSSNLSWSFSYIGRGRGDPDICPLLIRHSRSLTQLCDQDWEWEKGLLLMSFHQHLLHNNPKGIDLCPINNASNKDNLQMPEDRHILGRYEIATNKAQTILKRDVHIFLLYFHYVNNPYRSNLRNDRWKLYLECIHALFQSQNVVTVSISLGA